MNIALLSSYTVDFIKDKLKSLLSSDFDKIEIYQSPFNQYTQEILDKKSRFYSFSPDIVVFFADDETWIENQNHVFKLLRKAKKKLPKTSFLIGNIAQFNSKMLPSLQWNIKNSRAEQIATCNLKLAKLCQTNKQLYIVDVNDLIQLHGRLVMLDQRLQYLTKNPWSNEGIEIIALRLVQQISILMGKRKKVVVLDLDNTLWGGILGEDGIENILLSNEGTGKTYYDFQKNLLELYHSGVLLVICSKNDETLALEAIQSHPFMLIKKSHLAAWRINWSNKADNLISIADELNLSLDSFVVLDDSPHERKLLKFTLPQLKIPDLPTDPSYYAAFITSIPSLDAITITAEDTKRNEMYQQERIRTSQLLSAVSLEKFLESLNIQVIIQKATSFNIPRLTQLTQRTNQFNLRSIRYTEEQISQFIKDKNMLVLTITAKDLVGEMGIVGVIIGKKIHQGLFIDTFLMSCRVLGRGIEETALFALTKYGRRLKTTTLLGQFIPTKKNMMANDFYTKHFFQLQKNGIFKYIINTEKIEKPSWIKLSYE